MNELSNGPATKYTGPDSARKLSHPSIGAEIYQLVLHDLLERSDFGKRKYGGHPLRTTDGVDFLTNLYQELLDSLIYVRGAISREKELVDLLETAWGIIANSGWDAGTGDVSIERSPDWHLAALRFREEYFALLDRIAIDYTTVDEAVKPA